jgi:hypothetical protein
MRVFQRVSISGTGPVHVSLRWSDQRDAVSSAQQKRVLGVLTGGKIAS